MKYFKILAALAAFAVTASVFAQSNSNVTFNVAAYRAVNGVENIDIAINDGLFGDGPYTGSDPFTVTANTNWNLTVTNNFDNATFTSQGSYMQVGAADVWSFTASAADMTGGAGANQANLLSASLSRTSTIGGKDFAGPGSLSVATITVTIGP
ncbi:MAG TPA: hypothetical protein VNK96_02770 [Fimbriimonadales bacterium]|nr:hypothetical protein [Fimbriimonadales bacterium]